jgi:hypothetical protein
LPAVREHGPALVPITAWEVSVETIHFTIDVGMPGHSGTIDVDVDEYGELVDKPDVASDEGPLRTTLSIETCLRPDDARAIAAALTRAAEWVERARS